MNENELIQNLRLLKNIAPRTEYATQSKMAILSFPRKLKPRWEIVGKGVITESFNFGFSMMLIALALILILGGTASLLKFRVLNNLPGVDTQSLITEADNITKDIDIQLNEAEYYAVTANETSVALKEASLNGPAHTNPLLIENEAKQFDFENPANNDIDELLNTITQ